MLRRVVERARLVDDVGHVLGCRAGKAVVPALLDVQQLVERIAVGHPGRAFLVGAEQIAVDVEPQRDRETDAGRDDLVRLEIGRHADDRARFVGELILRLAVFVVQQRIGEVVRAAAEVNAAVLRVEGDAEPVDLVEAFLPAAGDFDFFVGLVVAIGIDDQHAPRFADDEHAVAALVAGRRQIHADRRPQAAGVVPEQVGFIFEPVAVRVAKQPDFAVVAEGDERAILAVLDVVDVREVERQLADR